MYEESEIKVFAGSMGKEVAKNVCNYLGSELGKSKVFTFSEGSIYVKVEETVRNKDVYLVQSIGLYLNSKKIKIISVAPLFAEAIRRIHRQESVSPLFDEVPIGVIQTEEM